MKAQLEHRVPLSDAAMAVLWPLHEVRFSPYAFPGLKRNEPLSHASLAAVLKRLGRRGTITVHGLINIPNMGGRAHQLSARDRRAGESALAF
jgi:hypothetical protein